MQPVATFVNSVYTIKIPDLGSQVHHLLFSHIQPANQPTAIGVALCHKKARDLCSNPICLRGDYSLAKFPYFI